MSALQYGLPLNVESSQNIMPVIRSISGEVLGFYAIAKTSFSGAEKSILVASGVPTVEVPSPTVEVPVTTVTLPKRVTDASNYGVPQYMAAVVSEADYKTQAYYNDSFVSSADSVSYSQWTMPATGARLNYSASVITQSLTVGMDDSAGGTPAANDPVTAANAAMSWTATLSSASLTADCAFFDFNWVNLFQAKSPDAKAVSIQIIANPAGGIFKSTIVPSPVASPQGGVIYNSVRVIRLNPVANGAYVFTYKITDDLGQSTTATLTLTVA